jgi:hypothetical protein
MRRSTQVTAPLLAAAALSMLTGCRKPDMQRCVDEQNNVVDNSFCKHLPNQQQRSDGHGGFIPFFPMYRYYYGGSGSYTPGTRADGGSYTPTAGRSYTTRGGFGSFFGGNEGSSGHAIGHAGS